MPHPAARSNQRTRQPSKAIAKAVSLTIA
jgi:hypothetical protein